MERVTLDVEKRDRIGKGAARSIRREGFIPAVLYKGGNSLPVQLSRKSLSQFVSKTSGEQIIVSLQFPDNIKQAIVKDYQVDPIKGNLLHVDFQEVLATEEVKVGVHVVTVGDAIGVKRDKGILQYGIREIEIECLPDKITGHIDVDISNLKIGQSIHVRDLKFEEGIRVFTSPDEVIATVTVAEEEVESPEKVAETAEPEVIKKGKKIQEGSE